MVTFSPLLRLLESWNKLTHFLLSTHTRVFRAFCSWVWKLVVLIFFGRGQLTVQTVTGIFLHRRKRSDYFQHIFIQTLLWEVERTLMYGMELCLWPFPRIIEIRSLFDTILIRLKIKFYPSLEPSVSRILEMCKI